MREKEIFARYIHENFHQSKILEGIEKVNSKYKRISSEEENINIFEKLREYID